MNRSKVFTALACTSSEYETHYGVIRIRYADYQRLVALAALVEVAKKKFTEVDAISCDDNLTFWFAAVPWVSTEVEARVEWQGTIKGELHDGYWVEVPEDTVEEESNEVNAVRTTSERVSVYQSELGFSFYEKHGDHEYTAPWLQLKTIAKFFGEE
jgi:hypothetical protein